MKIAGDGTVTAHGGELIELEVSHARSVRGNSQEIELSAKQRADLEMICIGAYSPLKGFMNQEDYHSVVAEMRLGNGTLWPIPLTFQLPRGTLRRGVDTLILQVASRPVGLLHVNSTFEADLEFEAEEVYGTSNTAHPGVAALYGAGSGCVSGDLEIFAIPRDFTGSEYLTPARAREAFLERGWQTTVAFQTRNPIHRAHEYLHKVALEIVDGLFLNPLVGYTKGDDVPAATRMRAYRALLENYYPKDRVILGVYPAAMRYAGPKEAVLHAISRKNYGCSHFIVGRDHAGVGDFYGTYAAQDIFAKIDPEELGIQIIKFEHSFFCRRCEQVVSKRTCPHGPSHHLTLSGSKVRELLRNGEDLPAHFSRPEVAAILLEAYRAI